MKNQKKKGISLIALVITIIVITILSASVILTVAINNPIESARKTAFQNDLAVIQEELNIYLSNKSIEELGDYDSSKLYADKDKLIEDNISVSDKNITHIIPSLKETYLDNIIISNGKLVYLNDENLKELAWANEILYGVKELNYEKVETQTETSSSITIKTSESTTPESFKIYGNSVTASGETQSLGDLVTDVSDENYNRYKIPITIKGKNIVNIADSNRATFKAGTAAGYWALSVFDNAWVLENLKPSTTYAASYDVECIEIPTDATQNAGTLGLTLYKDGAPVHFRDTYFMSEDETKNIQRVFTTPADLTEYNILAYSNRYALSDGKTYDKAKVIFKNLQIEEGNRFTDYEEYVSPVTTYIYLDEPLKKVGDNADYIDLKNQIIVRYNEDGTIESEQIDLSYVKVLLNKGTNIITIDTTVSPSNILVIYNK